MTASELLAAFDAQVRRSLTFFDPDTVVVDVDGPLLRVSGGHRGFVGYADLAGLTGPALDALIARTVGYFAERGESFEWKTYAHDEPPDLPQRLVAAGFVPEEIETVVVGESAALADTFAVSSAKETETVLVGESAALGDSAVLPDGLEIVTVTDRAGFDRIGAMESEVWGEDWSWLADDLAQRAAATPDRQVVLAAQAGGRTVSAAWLVFHPGTDFAGLFGGSTLPQWRGRGIYRALVARRARLAADAGVRYLQVDASPDSTPILVRLGFEAITRTTPYVWTP